MFLNLGLILQGPKTSVSPQKLVKISYYIFAPDGDLTDCGTPPPHQAEWLISQLVHSIVIDLSANDCDTPQFIENDSRTPHYFSKYLPYPPTFSKYLPYPPNFSNTWRTPQGFYKYLNAHYLNEAIPTTYRSLNENLI
jgi:hypothetical protein